MGCKRVAAEVVWLCGCRRACMTSSLDGGRVTPRHSAVHRVRLYTQHRSQKLRYRRLEHLPTTTTKVSRSADRLWCATVLACLSYGLASRPSCAAVSSGCRSTKRQTNQAGRTPAKCIHCQPAPCLTRLLRSLHPCVATGCSHVGL